MDNAAVAARLLAEARSLDPRCRDNLYRVRAYRQAAATLALLPQPLTKLLADAGEAGLARLPGVGRHLARSIAGLLTTGEWHTWPGRPSTNVAASCQNVLRSA